MPGADPASVCVYTALIGQYEALNEQPVQARSAMRFICITDDPHLTSDSWEIRLIEPVFPMDPIRSQRDVKLRPHVHLPEFEGSIYIDNSVVLTERPGAIWALRPSGTALAQPRHSFRETVMDEFLEVSRLGFDDQTRIFEQLNHYLLSHPEVLEQRPYWSAILLRDHRDARLRRTMDIWMAHLCRYSRRDQLSINMALHLGGVAAYALDLDNILSPFHRWPVTPRRDREKGPRNVITNLKPLAARVHELEGRVHELEGQERRLTESLESSQRARAEEQSAGERHVARVVADHLRAASEAQAVHEQEVARVVADHLQAASSAQAVHEQEIARLVETHGQAASQARAAHEQEVARLVQAQDSATAEAAALRAQHENEAARLLEAQASEARQLTEQHAARETQLQAEVLAIRRAATWRMMEPVRQVSARLPLVRRFIRAVARRLR
jgi:hypothetical protein